LRAAGANAVAATVATQSGSAGAQAPHGSAQPAVLAATAAAVAGGAV
jgi:hypothetical protein